MRYYDAVGCSEDEEGGDAQDVPCEGCPTVFLDCLLAGDEGLRARALVHLGLRREGGGQGGFFGEVKVADVEHRGGP